MTQVCTSKVIPGQAVAQLWCHVPFVNIAGLYLPAAEASSQLGLYGPFLYRLTTHPMAKAAFPSVFSMSSASTFLPPLWTRTMGTCKAAFLDQPLIFTVVKVIDLELNGFTLL